VRTFKKATTNRLREREKEKEREREREREREKEAREDRGLMSSRKRLIDVRVWVPGNRGNAPCAPVETSLSHHEAVTRDAGPLFIPRAIFFLVIAVGDVCPCERISVPSSEF